MRQRSTKALELLTENWGNSTAPGDEGATPHMITGTFTDTLTRVRAKADRSAPPRGCHLSLTHSALPCLPLWSP